MSISTSVGLVWFGMATYYKLLQRSTYSKGSSERFHGVHSTDQNKGDPSNVSTDSRTYNMIIRTRVYQPGSYLCHKIVWNVFSVRNQLGNQIPRDEISSKHLTLICMTEVDR